MCLCFVGKCYQARVNIGILFQPRFYKDLIQYYADQKKLIAMFQAIYQAFPTQEYYFAPFEVKEGTHGFETYDLTLFINILKAYHREQPHYFDLIPRSNEVLKSDFDEKLQKSLAKVKSFIVLTENALDEDQMKTLNTVKPGEVDVVNFALESKSVKEPTSEKKIIFSFEEVQLYIKELKEKQSKLICN